MVDRFPDTVTVAGSSCVPSAADQTSDGFRGPQVCTLVGITYRQLDYWARTGLLRPSIADARGISLQRARRAVECMRQGLGGDLAATNLVLVGTNSVLAHSDGEVVDLLKGGQGVLNIVPLSGVVEELNADILRIEREAQVAPMVGMTPAAGEAAGG